jgi:hypothetical protein
MTGIPNGLERRRTTEALWTAEEVAAFIKCSVSYVYKSAERGELPASASAGCSVQAGRGARTRARR